MRVMCPLRVILLLVGCFTQTSSGRIDEERRSISRTVNSPITRSKMVVNQHSSPNTHRLSMGRTNVIVASKSNTPQPAPPKTAVSIHNASIVASKGPTISKPITSSLLVSYADQHLTELSLLSSPVPGILCPASGASKLENSVAFQYPLDVYGTVSFTNTNAHAGIYKDCGTWDKRSMNRTHLSSHYCEVSDFCPIHQQNLLDATHIKMNETASTSQSLSYNDAPFCQLHKALESSDSKVNIVVFGGSLLTGLGSFGCYKLPLSGCSFYECRQCNWFTRFYEYLRSTYRTAKISTYNFGFGGHSSIHIAGKIKDWLKGRGLTTFSHNDVIFLDAATNDQTCTKRNCLESIEGSLSFIIKEIYEKSPITRPVIIILESEVLSKVISGDVEPVYTTAYRLVSAKYGIPIWSYRNAALSHYTEFNQTKYYKRLRFLDNFLHKEPNKPEFYNHHPPWDLHLFQADLYAAVLEAKFAQCGNVTSSLSSQLSLQNQNIKNLLQQQNNNERGGGGDDAKILTCTDDAIKHLEISFETHTTATSRKKVLIGTFHSEPKGAWLVRQDLPGKPTGLITEIAPSLAAVDKSRTSITHMQIQKENKVMTHISNNNGSVLSTLVFTVANITKQEIYERKSSFILSLYYLRTYLNAGVVKLRFCGQDLLVAPVGSASSGSSTNNSNSTGDVVMLDALWEDHAEYRYSLPHIFAQRLDYQSCIPSSSVANRTEDTSAVTVEMLHINRNDQPEVRTS